MKGSIPWNKGIPGKRPKGLVYKKHKENPTSFRPGSTPWNKGIAGTGRCKANSGSIKPGQRLSPKTEFQVGATLAEKNARWKGDDVGYSGLHLWVYQKLGKASVCTLCGSTRWVQWANKSKKYQRNTRDWVSLCSVCHRAFDGVTKLTKAQADSIKQRVLAGETQRSIAKCFGVHQATISNISLGKIQFYG
jgi:hypothetical protein